MMKFLVVPFHPGRHRLFGFGLVCMGSRGSKMNEEMRKENIEAGSLFLYSFFA